MCLLHVVLMIIRICRSAATGIGEFGGVTAQSSNTNYSHLLTSRLITVSLDDHAHVACGTGSGQRASQHVVDKRGTGLYSSLAVRIACVPATTCGGAASGFAQRRDISKFEHKCSSIQGRRRRIRALERSQLFPHWSRRTRRWVRLANPIASPHNSPGHKAAASWIPKGPRL